MGFIADLLGAKNNYRVDEGLPAGFQQGNYRTALSQALQGINTPQFDPTMANASAGQQNDLVAALQQQLTGQGPSVAQNLLQNTTSQNIAQAAGQIGSIRGMNPALAARLIAQNAASQNQMAAGQGATLRAQEQLGTQSVLANALAAKRNADIGQATNAAQIGLGGLDAQTSRLGTVGGLANQQNSTILQNKLGSAGINSGVAQQNANTNAGIASGIFGGAASAGMKLAGFNDGGVVPGTAPVAGDHPANDKVPAMLSPGEIVVPRSAAKDPEKAKAFIDALKSRSAPKKTTGYGDVLASRRELDDRLSILEMACGGMVHGMANGGVVQAPPPPTPAQVQNGFLSNLGAAYLKKRMMRAGG